MTTNKLRFDHILQQLEKHGWVTPNGFTYFGGSIFGFYVKQHRTIRVSWNEWGVFARFHS